MLKLLIIDDEHDPADALKDDLAAELKQIRCDIRICGEFEKARDHIVGYNPDVVILDLLLNSDAPGPSVPGLDVSKYIWEEHFCPIIVYSAEPDRHKEINKGHPFLKEIAKGRDGPRSVAAALRKFEPHVRALKEASDHIKAMSLVAMRDVAPQAFNASSTSEQQINIVKRTGRRRVAALMDGLSSDDLLAPWEIYLCPPVSGDVQLGDIIKEVKASPADPTKFCVVLTPSCDLVRTEKRDPKVFEVLVASCTSTRCGLDRTALKEMSIGKLKDRISAQMLAPGHVDGIVPFPKYLNRIPTMVADLRKLKLIPLDKIGSGPEKEYERIASIDSPFREMIAWSYMQIACRPGLPDRDPEAWKQEIVDELREDAEK